MLIVRTVFYLAIIPNIFSIANNDLFNLYFCQSPGCLKFTIHIANVMR